MLREVPRSGLFDKHGRNVSISSELSAHVRALRRFGNWERFLWDETARRIGAADTMWTAVSPDPPAQPTLARILKPLTLAMARLNLPAAVSGTPTTDRTLHPVFAKAVTPQRARETRAGGASEGGRKHKGV